MPHDNELSFFGVELDELKQDVFRQSWRGARRDRQYSPLGDDDYHIPTPSIREQPTIGLDQSTESLIKDSSKSEKQSYWKNFKGPERPKRVCRTGVWAVLRHLAFFHILPIGITLALLGLYVHRIRWGNLTEEQLNFLQFAAKAHEILILVSLTDILLQRICYSLFHEDDGVPLGLLSAPFYLGSPLQYFFSWEFWAGLLQPGAKPKRARSWMTGTVIIVTILLSVAAAPLSAIVMIPREGWWQVYVPWDERSDRRTYFKPDIYPNDLGADQADFYVIEHESNSTLFDPLSLLLPILRDTPGGNMETSRRQLSNVSFTNYPQRIGSDREISLTQDFEQLSLELAVATTPMDTLTNQITYSWHAGELAPNDLLIKSYWKTLRSPSRKLWKQPLVAVECAYNRTSDFDAAFLFSANMSSNDVTLTFDQNPEFKDLVTEARNMSKNQYPKTRHRILTSLDKEDPRISANFLLLEEVPKYFDNGTLDDEYPNTASEKELGLHLCRVYARWAEVDLWIDRGISNFARSKFDYALFDIWDLLGDTAEAYKPIKLRKKWLETVGQRRNKTDKKADLKQDSIWDKAIDIADEIRTREPYSSAEANGNSLQMAIAVHLADILSRMGPDYYDKKGIRPFDEDDGTSPGPDNPIVEHEFFLGGYGYSIRSSNTIPLALAILLLHVAIVLIHAMVILFSRHRWLSSCWGSFGEILILALCSKKHDLGNVGGGVDSSRTWSTPAVVRAVGNEGRLEMVLRQGNSDELIKREGYVGEEGIGNGYTRVEPGIKYR
ncbi:uncharacterized protein FIESC28_06922 [Fusarium coffeatum]|uniref:Uncharacterized protein n=1 Tax=Fusarium coffeatum TaxID=231269 RepID=A0A366RHA6_9HYPO|nr:uncharacterized protein FIESC28_06922 [Fusarium coffeatum]RBR16513.1 hypothetical protein FIESC28_06922 [Fusarium coffeatum]